MSGFEDAGPGFVPGCVGSAAAFGFAEASDAAARLSGTWADGLSDGVLDVRSRPVPPICDHTANPATISAITATAIARKFAIRDGPPAVLGVTGTVEAGAVAAPLPRDWGGVLASNARPRSSNPASARATMLLG